MPAEVTARAFWTVAPGQGEIRAEALPEPGPSEVRVKALVSGISRGTEALVFQGRIPAGEYDRMRCPFQAGQFPFPVKYGYASVGMIEAGPPALIGQRVFALHPHQDRYVVPESAVIPLPESVPSSRAVLAANLETAVNGLWDAAPRIGDRIAIVGAGVVGCCAALLASSIPGTEVQLIDTDPARAAFAAALNLDFALPDQAMHDADLVIQASGAPEGLALALDLAGFEATVLDLSWYGSQAVTLPLGGAFHSRRLTLRSSQVGHVATAQRARWPHRRRLALALALLADRRFDHLLTGSSAFDDLPAAMARLAPATGTPPSGTLCHSVIYS